MTDTPRWATQLPTATATHRGALRHRCLKFDGSIFLYSILCYPRGCTNLIMLLESQVHLPSQKASLTVKNFMPNLCALFPARLCYCWMMASSRRLTMTVAASKQCCFWTNRRHSGRCGGYVTGLSQAVVVGDCGGVIAYLIAMRWKEKMWKRSCWTCLKSNTFLALRML